MAITEKLSAIGNAIREKTGTTELMTLDAMPTAIKGISTGGDIPEERFKITGNCDYMFTSPSWSWYIEEFGDKITTESMENANYMFMNSSVESIPFDLNFDGSFNNTKGMFQGSKAKEIGKISNLQPYTMESMFDSCTHIRYLPELDIDWDYVRKSSASTCMKNVFYYCTSLRSIPEEIVKEMYFYRSNIGASSPFSSFQWLMSMDEIRGLNPASGNQSSNIFLGFGQTCCRWKEVLFVTNDDGTPIDVNWENQTISLASVGYAPISDIICSEANNGITADKEVTDAASYQALKNDPDWFTSNAAYSRYNHDSAVNTINTLPNIATGSGNTIKFKGEAGSQTDGRAINTLTDSEIAVAVDKGWTVSFV